MDRTKLFIKNHALWIGLVAVIIPLIVHLGLQYRSLAELESARPEARRWQMRKYLNTLTQEITKLYRTKAEKLLDLSPEAFTACRNDLIVEHFQKYQFKGARRLFITSRPTSDLKYAIILFYNPWHASLESDQQSPDWRAAYAGAANWMAMIQTGSVPESPRLSVDERDPRNRILVKPIIDAAGKVVGVAGMILDEGAFLKYFLPQAIKSTLPKAFPDEADEIIITVLDSSHKLIYSNRPFEGKNYEAGGYFPFIFTDWYLGIRMREWTEEEMARRSFIISFSSSILTALVLVSGIALALRTASRAIKLSQMKADFVSNVSHELRTPLASIRVFGEFLKLGRVRDVEKIREYGEYIENESRRLTQLINNILDFSKIESGQKTYRFEMADLRSMIEDLVKLFEGRMAQSAVEIRLEAQAAPLPPVYVDREAIAQAFINLLDNAVKYSGQSTEILVRLYEQDRHFCVSVIDHGIGIEEDEFEKIFEKFYRVSTGLVHDVKGSGLGLSIVKHVVEAHRGRVRVASVPGRGSTFTIELPVAVAAEQTERGGESLQSEGLGA